jgi:hypothetical protein
MSDFPPPPPGGPTPPPPPGGYGYGAPQYGPSEHPKAGTIFTLGIVSLVLGVIGLFCCAFLGLLGIAPLVMSGSALREIEASGGQLSGADKVKNGRTMGIIAICLTVLGVIINVVLVATGALDGFMDTSTM